MKKLLLLLLILGNVQLFSQTKDKEEIDARFQSMMNRAHPLPEQNATTKGSGKYAKKIGYIRPFLIPTELQSSQIPSFFVNISMANDGTDPNPTQNESSIAVNPTNPLNLISSAVDYRANSSTWVYSSQDGGKTWTNTNLGKPFNNAAWRSTNDPSVAYSLDGIGYLCYGGFNNIGTGANGVLSGRNGVFISRTRDGGKTWDLTHKPVIVHTEAPTLDSAFEDKYYVQVDNSETSQTKGWLTVPWKRVIPRDSSTQIVLSRSSDQGNTWSEVVNVSNKLSGSSEDTTFGQSFPLACTGPQGELFVVWNHGIEKGIGFSASFDQGTTFTAPRIIHRKNTQGVPSTINGATQNRLKGTVRAESYPTFGCNVTQGTPGYGNIYLIWSADKVPNIYFSKSSDNGNTWTSPKIIHSDTTNDQFWPWLAIDPTNGDLAVMYSDSRNDPNNMMVECYVSYSNDQGETWVDRQVSDVAMDLRNNPFSGTFAGDYSGCAFHAGKVYPSWVDMRNSSNAATIADNDVYTAYINVNAPEPASNFVVRTIPNEPTKLQLNWLIPTKRSFGQPLLPNEFSYALYRDSVYLTTLSANTQNYIDTDLMQYKEYHYELLVVSNTDTSGPRNGSAFAGGSPNPDKPTFQFALGSESGEIQLGIKTPNLRSDSLTALVNLATIQIYRDSVFLKEVQVRAQDTNTTIFIIDKPDEQGWYVYQAKVADASNPKNVSDISNAVLVFSGPINTSLYDDVDEKEKKYFKRGRWGRTNEFFLGNTGYSMKNIPNSNYRAGQQDTLLLFPIYQDGFESPKLLFWESAFIHRSDTGYVQLSNDMGRTWRTISTRNATDYSPWEANQLTQDSWKYTVLDLPNQIRDTILVRFVFVAGPIQHSRGWYVDNIEIGVVPVSVSNNETTFSFYPNPAKEVVHITGLNEEVKEVTSSNVLGNTLPIPILYQSNTQTTISVKGLPTGIHFFELTLKNGKKIRTTLMIR
jgi:hypothetical protein